MIQLNPYCATLPDLRRLTPGLSGPARLALHDAQPATVVRGQWRALAEALYAERLIWGLVA